MSQAIPLRQLSTPPTNVAIPTIPFTCLKGLHENCMRHWWGTTMRGDKDPETEKISYLKGNSRPKGTRTPCSHTTRSNARAGGTAPVTEPCTRSGALHPIRKGALPTDRVQHPNTQEQTRNWQNEPPLAHSVPERTKQPRPRPTGIGDEAGAGSAEKRGDAYSLTPPAVRPETMYFCRYWNSRITGMAAMTEPAAKMLHGAVRSSDAHMYMPTARVNWL